VAGDAGRILISTPEGVIQLKSGINGITLYTAGNINIAAPIGDVNIQAGGNINLDAGRSVNIRSGGQSSVTSLGKVVVGGVSGADVGITGTPLNLNTSVAPGIPRLTTVPVVGKYLN
jgi:uncharacterized protein (DUF2345 family)